MCLEFLPNKDISGQQSSLVSERPVSPHKTMKTLKTDTEMRAEAMSRRVWSSVDSVSLPCPSFLLAGPSLELRDCGGLAWFAWG